jgi:colicin import membrane protein
MLESDLPSPGVPLLTDGRRREKPIDRMMGGLVGSSGLHLLVLLLLVFGPSWATQVPPPLEQIVPINLVQLGDKTASPSSPQMAPLPQEKARETAPLQSAEAVPVAQTPPPQAAPHQAEAKAMPDLLTAMKQEPKPAVPKPVNAPKPDTVPAAKLRPQPLPADDLSTRLKSLARLRQPAPPMPPKPRQEEGSGASNLTASSANSAAGRDATYSVKDFIRAQVERHWNLDVNAPKGSDWVVAMHIVLRPDGSVSRAEVVETPRYRSDSAYRDFALSARNAVLLSSPLTMPPGDYDIAKDIILDFDSKQVQQ